MSCLPTLPRRLQAGIAWSLLVAIELGAAGLARADFVWVEGESSREHTMRRHGWYDSVTKQALSGGDWLSSFGGDGAPEAKFTLTVPESARYDFWVRLNPVGGARISYRFGGGEWTRIDTSRTVEELNIAADGKPDLRFIAWVRAGSVELERGEATLRFRFESSNQHHGAIDCFVLSKDAFRPRGTLKPGERSGRANPGFFAWEPPVDPFTADALVDLSALNEDVAGANGRVRREGSDFVLGSGKKVKFWATNAGPGIWSLDPDSHVYLARRLAKCGVNMVRLHGALYGSRDPTIDRRKLDDLHHLVAALKDEGIYTSLSFFFPLWFELDPGKRSFMVLFFDEEMQRTYFEWAKVLLSTTNPYTKRPLGADPAVAIVEVVNEDSQFFWTFGKKNTTERRWEELQSLYGAWLVERYGSLDSAFAAWGGARSEGDAPESGRVDLYGAWEMTADGVRANPDRRRRVSDQVRFLTESMRGFYERAIRYFEKECGYDGLVSCGNWHVADPATLDALERYAYTAGDVIDHHGYFDHGHEGEAASWSIRPGHEFKSESALTLEHANPLPYVETDGFPHIVSEIGWPAPNLYRAEFPFLAAVYGSLQGLDGIFSFALGSADWDQHMGKFAVSTPAILGSFPGAALAYRRGDIQEAPVVVLDALELDDLFGLEGTAVHASGAYDQLRAESVPDSAERSKPVRAIDPRTFYVGRVVRTFAEGAHDARKDIDEFIDHERNIIRSATGELTWNYQKGIATVSTSRTQGAVGFLGRAGKIELDQITIDAKNDYASVMVVTLDGLPIPDSAKVLIQCLTVEQFDGFRATGEDNLSGRIGSVGSAPVGVERYDVSVTIELHGDRPAHVRACDEHGYPRRRSVEVSRSAGTLRVLLDETSPYHVIER